MRGCDERYEKWRDHLHGEMRKAERALDAEGWRALRREIELWLESAAICEERGSDGKGSRSKGENRRRSSSRT